MPNILLNETNGKVSGRNCLPVYFTLGARKWDHLYFLKTHSHNFFFPAGRTAPLPHVPNADIAPGNWNAFWLVLFY